MSRGKRRLTLITVINYTNLHLFPYWLVPRHCSAVASVGAAGRFAWYGRWRRGGAQRPDCSDFSGGKGPKGYLTHQRCCMGLKWSVSPSRPHFGPMPRPSMPVSGKATLFRGASRAQPQANATEMAKKKKDNRKQYNEIELFERGRTDDLPHNTSNELECQSSRARSDQQRARPCLLCCALLRSMASTHATISK